MADVHDEETRRKNMQAIKSKNTRPEMLVRQFLHSRGFRYRLHVKDLPGKPDVVLPKYKTAIFIHGCFWHGHENCKYFVVPKTKTQWWLDKIASNKSNDKSKIEKLEGLGWKVLTVWECQLKGKLKDLTLSGITDSIIS